MVQLPLKYTGDEQPQPGKWSELVQTTLYPYYPSPELIEAVNLALLLKRPLLLEGEPGCGKSRLAYALVYELSQRYKQINWKFRLWNVQSTSKAEEGFYTYDYIGRLQAAQLQQTGIKESQKNPSNTSDFLENGPLGDAFQDKEAWTVVLIDEIDKADRDFPNDLLLAIEEGRYFVKPINEWWEANKEKPPIIIITSNQEKKLPRAFLRRCLYHYIELPNQEELKRILEGRFKEAPEAVVTQAIDKFLELREQMDERKVSTSELIDWFQALIGYEPDKVLEKLGQKDLPYATALLKEREERQDFL